MNRNLLPLMLVAAGLTAGSAIADQIVLTGVIRDFKYTHPDMNYPEKSFGLHPGLVMSTLNEDGKPALNTAVDYHDGMIHSPDSFQQWYSSVPGVNIEILYAITLDNGQSESGGVYSFIREVDNGGFFFPIDHQGWNDQNMAADGDHHNFYFTYELHTQFTYVPGHRFTFTGDDDVWVFINGQKVIDLGGVHAQETGSILLFDGKVFVENAQFQLGGEVQSVSNPMAGQLAQQWDDLGLEGACPIQSGSLYIDLDLNHGGPDIRVELNGDSVTTYSAQDLSNVVLEFEDGTTQKFEDLTGPSGTFSGTGDNAGKTIVGAWVKSGDNDSGDGPGYGQHFTPTGNDTWSGQLDFFFAERHVTQSNFRMETTLMLQGVPPTTTSPLYD